MPLGSNLATPQGLIVSIDLLWEKNSKIFFSETTGPTALIFCMWQWLMVLYINCAYHVPGVKFGHVPGVDSLHRPTIGKTKKIFFSETTSVINLAKIDRSLRFKLRKRLAGCTSRPEDRFKCTDPRPLFKCAHTE